MSVRKLERKLDQRLITKLQAQAVREERMALDMKQSLHKGIYGLSLGSPPKKSEVFYG